MTIDEPIALPKNLTDDWIAQLGDDAARLRKVGKAADGLEEATHNECGIVRRLATDVLVDGREIIAGLRRPEDRGHRE